MKTHQLSLMTLLLVFYLTSYLKAQIPAIESLQIIPANPTINDSIKIISHTIFPSGGCQLTSSSVNISGSTITVNANHTLGMLAVICYSTDTITIGILNDKKYELFYKLSTSNPQITNDIDTLSIIVQQPAWMQNISNQEQKSIIYPNPVTNEINIRPCVFINEKYDVEIYSLLGQKIKTIRNIKNQISIDCKEMTDGIYYIIIKSIQKQWVQKIIKTTR